MLIKQNGIKQREKIFLVFCQLNYACHMSTYLSFVEWAQFFPYNNVSLPVNEAINANDKLSL